ncbi:MAG: hypothetical protein Q8P22_06745, partial [Chloroflexota bacterium]|nr:hypothetical protein [Chloroflexota bacterium]
MKATGNTAVLSGLSGVIILALAALGLWTAGGSEEAVQASGGTGSNPTITGIDMITTGNGPTTLGTIDRCVQANVNDTIQIDTFIDDVPSGAGIGNFGGFGYVINAADASKVVPVASGWNHGAGTSLIMVDPQSVLLDLTFITATGYGVTVSDIYNPPGDAGEPSGSRGVLGRYSWTVVGGAGTTTYLFFTLGTMAISDPLGTQMNDIPANVSPGDDDFDGLTDEDPILHGLSYSYDSDGDTSIGEDPIDGSDNDGDGLVDEDPLGQYGLIAITPATCPPEPTPTPTPTLLPAAVGGIAELPDVAQT